MKGLLISLMKDILLNSEKDVNEQNRKEHFNMLWMYYDRIKMEEITDFSNYYISPRFREDWTGHMYSLYLYSGNFHSDNLRSDNFRLDYKTQDKNRQTLIKSENGEFSFFCVITLKYASVLRLNLEWNQEIENSQINQAMVKGLDLCIKSFFESKGAALDYDIFCSLGAEDLVVIMVGNSLVNFFEVIDEMKKMTIEVSSENVPAFDITNSFLGQNRVHIDEAPNIDALIKLTLKPGVGFGQFKAALKKELPKKDKDGGVEYQQCMGEYDVQLRVSGQNSKMMNLLYGESGIFRGGIEFYNRYIYQSKTIWLHQGTDQNHKKPNISPIKISNLMSIEEIAKSSYWPSDVHISTGKEALITLLDKVEVVKRTPHFKEILKLLIVEYDKYMHSVESWHWRVDLYKQLRAFVTSFEHLSENQEGDVILLSENEKIVILRNTIASLQQTYTHISQTNKMFFELPNANLYYTGSYNHIIRAFYGIIKMLFSIGFTRPHDKDSKQSEVAFTVNFEMTSRVKSNIYLFNSKKDDVRLISFDLPYEAIYNVPKYTFYLAHEVFHYIAPFSREKRNKAVFCIWIELLVINIIREFTQDAWQIIMRTNKDGSEEGNEQTSLDELSLDAIIQGCIYNIDPIVEELYKDIAKSKALNFDMDLTFMLFVREIDIFFNGDDINPGVKRTTYIDKVFEFLKKQIMQKNFFEKVMNYIDVDSYPIESAKVSISSMLGSLQTKFSEESYLADAKNFMKKFYMGEKYNTISNLRKLIYDGMKEAACDMFMIEVFQISLLEYLDLMTVFLKENFFMSEKIKPNFQIRLGIIIDSFYGKESAGEIIYDSVTPSNWFRKLLKNNTIGLDEQFIEYYDDYLKTCSRYRWVFNNCLKEGYFVNVDKYLNQTQRLELHKNLKILRKYYKFYNEHCLNEEESKKNKNLFALNIFMIEYFQKQNPLVNINQCELTIPADSSDNNVHREINKIEPVASSIGEYFEQISHAINFLSLNNRSMNKQGLSFWFRGVCNEGYGLSPSLFRNCPEGIAPYSFQVAQLKELHIRTSSYSDLWLKQMPYLYDRMACLQHYGYKTNLLDFTPDALTALHFALNPDVPPSEITDAAVYIFDPLAYQLAVDDMMGVSSKQIYPYNSALDLAYCKEEGGDYILSDISSSEILKRHHRWLEENEHFNNPEDEEAKKKSVIKYPKPFFFPHTNQRILAQEGTFMAFNLMSNISDGKYDYLCLKEIQKDFVAKGKKPFMQRILINKSAFKTLRNQLKNMGISAAKMYPELDKKANESSEVINSIFKDCR